MPKTAFLQIRFSQEDLERVRRAALADHLDTSTWARRIVLKAVEVWEKGRLVGGVLRSGAWSPTRR
jgi:hypothetical protein